MSGWGGDQPLEPLAKVACLGVHLVEEAGLRDLVHHRAAHGAAERVAAIGGAVGSRRHAARGLFGSQKRADGIAAADALGDHHDVGG